MKERIKELALLSGFDIDTNVSFAEKTRLKCFAELIIQDCIDCVDGYTKPRTFGTHYDAVEQIKANFGIEQ